MDFILASKSPQRKRILKDLGIRFQAIPANIDEKAGKLKKPHAIAKKIATDKAFALSKQHPNTWVIGCDTFVILSDGTLALKPKNKKEAKETLLKYRDSYCDVYSGLALINESANKKYIGFKKTRLTFKDFSEKELENYLKSNEWKDKSGSMTIEGKAGEWIIKTEGDYWNVVGLPVELLKKFLKEIKKGSISN